MGKRQLPRVLFSDFPPLLYYTHLLEKRLGGSLAYLLQNNVLFPVKFLGYDILFYSFIVCRGKNIVFIYFPIESNGKTTRAPVHHGMEICFDEIQLLIPTLRKISSNIKEVKPVQRKN